MLIKTVILIVSRTERHKGITSAHKETKYNNAKQVMKCSKYHLRQSKCVYVVCVVMINNNNRK